MQKRLLILITSWPFILCVTLLLLNDWWLKAACPGILSGKLSDFAGIGVVALLLLAAYPQRSLIIFCCISITFFWWKSPASDNFISFFNHLGLYNIGRTVDYSDLIALTIFPLCHAVTLQGSRFAIPRMRIRQYMAAPIAAVTLFAILGTSSRPTTQDFIVRPVSAAEDLQRSEVEEVIKSVAAKHGLTRSEQITRADVLILSDDEMNLTCSFPNRKSVSVSITVQTYGVIAFPWTKTHDEKIDELNMALKKSLADRFKGLEYIEPLGRH